MHEVGMMQNLLDAAVGRAQQEGAQHIRLMHLRVGEESGVVPESLKLAFDIVRKGTIAEEAKLELENVPVVCYCPHCQHEYQPADLLHECPKCQQQHGDVRQGKEFELAFLEVS